MAVVKAAPGQSTDQVIRAFQKKVIAEDILNELREKDRYEKPSTKRKNQALARKRGGRRRYAS